MKSLQCEQKVGCFKMVAINLCSLTICTRRLTAPRLLFSRPCLSVNSRVAKPGVGLFVTGDCWPVVVGIVLAVELAVEAEPVADETKLVEDDELEVMLVAAPAVVVEVVMVCGGHAVGVVVVVGG